MSICNTDRDTKVRSDTMVISSLLRESTYGITPSDLMTCVSVTVLLLAIIAAATYIPA